MTIKQLLSLFLVTMLLVPLTVKAEKCREFLNGKTDAYKCIGVINSYPGIARSHKVNDNRDEILVDCSEDRDRLCYEIGLDDGWYADIYYPKNAIIPPYDLNSNLFLIKVPQEPGGLLIIQQLRKGYKKDTSRWGY